MKHQQPRRARYGETETHGVTFDRLALAQLEYITGWLSAAGSKSNTRSEVVRYALACAVDHLSRTTKEMREVESKFASMLAKRECNKAERKATPAPWKQMPELNLPSDGLPLDEQLRRALREAEMGPMASIGTFPELIEQAKPDRRTVAQKLEQDDYDMQQMMERRAREGQQQTIEGLRSRGLSESEINQALNIKPETTHEDE